MWWEACWHHQRSCGLEADAVLPDAVGAVKKGGLRDHAAPDVRSAMSRLGASPGLVRRREARWQFSRGRMIGPPPSRRTERYHARK
jgi:hypothetical protein